MTQQSTLNVVQLSEQNENITKWKQTNKHQEKYLNIVAQVRRTIGEPRKENYSRISIRQEWPLFSIANGQRPK